MPKRAQGPREARGRLSRGSSRGKGVELLKKVMLGSRGLLHLLLKPVVGKGRGYRWDKGWQKTLLWTGFVGEDAQQLQQCTLLSSFR